MKSEPALVLPENEGALMPISDGDFNAIRDMVYKSFGISLSDQKRALVVGRLQPLLRQRRLNGFQEYIDFVRKDASGAALSELADRISTNHTHFFREPDHFSFLTERVLPEVVESARRKNDRDLRFWCAACSSGEEAYTLQISIMEHLGSDYQNWNAGLLATDISDRVLTIARNAVYSEDRLHGVPDSVRKRYFSKVDGDSYRIVDTVRKEVLFRRFNLMNTRFPFNKQFHFIFCRNVMIYFDIPTREALVRRFAEHLVPGGYLFIGHSESLSSLNVPLQYVQPAVYQKKA
jgi:chemotaxis protein methyltransferase CheR